MKLENERDWWKRFAKAHSRVTPMHNRIFPDHATLMVPGWPDEWKREDGSVPYWGGDPNDYFPAPDPRIETQRLVDLIEGGVDKLPGDVPYPSQPTIDYALGRVPPDWWVKGLGEKRSPVRYVGDVHESTGWWFAELQHVDGGRLRVSTGRTPGLALLGAILRVML